MSNTPTKDLMVARYYELCDKRDAVYAAIKASGLQKELDETNAECERLRVHALEVKAEIESMRDGPAWLDLKREIGVLAGVLRFIPPRPAK